MSIVKQIVKDPFVHCISELFLQNRSFCFPNSLVWTVVVPVIIIKFDWLMPDFQNRFIYFIFQMSDHPIKTVSGRRLIIENVSDNKTFSARRNSFNAKELTVNSYSPI